MLVLSLLPENYRRLEVPVSLRKNAENADIFTSGENISTEIKTFAEVDG